MIQKENQTKHGSIKPVNFITSLLKNGQQKKEIEMHPTYIKENLLLLKDLLRL